MLSPHCYHRPGVQKPKVPQDQVREQLLFYNHHVLHPTSIFLNLSQQQNTSTCFPSALHALVFLFFFNLVEMQIQIHLGNFNSNLADMCFNLIPYFNVWRGTLGRKGGVGMNWGKNSRMEVRIMQCQLRFNRSTEPLFIPTNGLKEISIILQFILTR